MGHDRIQEKRDNADQRKQNALTKHQDKIKDHHGRIDNEGGKGTHQRSCDGSIQGKSPLYVTCKSL